MYNWLKKQKGHIFSPQKAKEFKVTQAVDCIVLFTNGTIDNQVDVSDIAKIWFHVTDFKGIAKIIETLRGGVEIRPHEMQKITEYLGIDENMQYNPNQRKKTDWDWTYFLNTSNFQLAWTRINRHSEPSVKDYLSYQAFEKDLESNVQHLIKDIEESGEYTVSSVGYFQVPKNTFTYRPQVALPASDSIVYQAIINIIADKYEIQLTEHAGIRSFGNIYAGRKSEFMFKKWKSMYIQFQNTVEKMRKEKGFKWQAEIDISGFYDNIQHSILKKILQGKIDDKLCKLLIRFLEDCQERCTDSRLPFGIPQGPIPSHLLANVYLLELDDILKANEIQYARYVDDFWIVSESQTHLIETIVNLQNQLGKLGLSLQSKKTSIQEIEKSDPPDFASFGSYAQSPAFTDSPTIDEIHPESPSQQDLEITEYNEDSEPILEELKGISEYHSTSELLDVFHQNADSWLESEQPSRKNESQIIFAIYRLYLQGHRDDNIRDKVFYLSEKMFWRFDRFSLYLQLFHNDPVVEDFLLKELHTSPYDFIKACCWRSLSSVAPNKHTDKAIEVIKDSSREYTVRVGALEYIVKQSSYSEQHIELLLSLLKPQSNSFFGKFLFHHLLAMTKRFRMSTQRSEMIWWGLEHPSEELARIAYLNSTQEDLKSYQEKSVKQSNLNEGIKDSVLRTHYRIEAICTQIRLLPEGKDFDFHILFTEEEYSRALALLNHIQRCLADKTYWNGACAEIWTLIRICVCAATQQKDYNEAVKQFPHRSYIKHAVKLKEYDSNLRSKDINPEELKKYRQMAQNTLMAIINWNQKKRGGITSPVFVC